MPEKSPDWYRIELRLKPTTKRQLQDLRGEMEVQTGKKIRMATLIATLLDQALKGL